MSKVTKTPASAKNQPAFIAYHVSEGEKARWTRIGAAWTHKDGEGFSLELDCIPIASGQIVLRKFNPKEEGAV